MVSFSKTYSSERSLMRGKPDIPANMLLPAICSAVRTERTSAGRITAHTWKRLQEDVI